MQYTLVERDGKLYARLSMSDFSTPTNIINFFPLSLTYHQFRMMFQTEEMARQALNTPLHMTNTVHCTFKDDRGINYHMSDYGKTLPEYSEIEPVPEPKHHKNSRVFWKNGQWYKETSRGVTLA